LLNSVNSDTATGIIIPPQEPLQEKKSVSMAPWRLTQARWRLSGHHRSSPWRPGGSPWSHEGSPWSLGDSPWHLGGSQWHTGGSQLRLGGSLRAYGETHHGRNYRYHTFSSLILLSQNLKYVNSSVATTNLSRSEYEINQTVLSNAYCIRW
jgi:hypothetical protein